MIAAGTAEGGLQKRLVDGAGGDGCDISHVLEWEGIAEKRIGRQEMTTRWMQTPFSSPPIQAVRRLGSDLYAV